MRGIITTPLLALTITGCVTDQEATLQEAVRISAPPPKTGPTHYDILKARATGPWRHVPEPVSNEQLARDKAKCRTQMAMVPLNPLNSPAVVEIRLYSFFIDCMEAEGYVASRS